MTFPTVNMAPPIVKLTVKSIKLARLKQKYGYLAKNGVYKQAKN